MPQTYLTKSSGQKMDLLNHWKAVTSKNSEEKCIRGITGEKN